MVLGLASIVAGNVLILKGIPCLSPLFLSMHMTTGSPGLNAPVLLDATPVYEMVPRLFLLMMLSLSFINVGTLLILASFQRRSA